MGHSILAAATPEQVADAAGGEPTDTLKITL